MHDVVERHRDGMGVAMMKYWKGNGKYSRKLVGDCCIEYRLCVWVGLVGCCRQMAVVGRPDGISFN